MKIVVLDGFTLNPGDLSWEPLKQLGDFFDYDRTTRDDVVARAKGAEALLTNKVVLDRTIIEQLPGLRYIGVTATGTNIVDLAAARERGIIVTNAPAYSTASVAQAIFASLFELTNHVAHYNNDVHQGAWSQSPDFCYFDKQIITLSGMTMGIIGLGHIGREVAKIAQAFGMKILIHTRTQHLPETDDLKYVALPELFKRSDVVSLHCALTPETKNIINAHNLSLMKPSAFLVNFARGPLVDEQALADALNNGRLAGAAIDVLSAEPPPKDNPLLTARNCIITPHIAWASLAARQKLMEIVVGNLRGFLQGQSVNIVNP